MIELQELSRSYGEVDAVRDLSLHVDEGELLVLVGGSGSGKTTTLKMVNRLIEPSAGRVLLDGEDVSKLPAPELRRRIGYVFQRLGLFPHMSVAENVGITPALLGWDPPRIRRRVEEVLESVALDAGFADRSVDELSGGQKQRVSVARALAARPRVMLLDEPFGALDPLNRDRLQQLLLRVRREVDLTAIFVTHDMAEALQLADRIAILEEGRLVQVGTPREILHAPADEAVEEMLRTPQRQARTFDRLFGED